MKKLFYNSTLKSLLPPKNYQKPSILSCKFCSSNAKEDRLRYQNELFDAERARQAKNFARIEKISVKYIGPPSDQKLIMNKNISTPYDCARHMYEMLVRRSALALVNGEKLWDMHRPLEYDCELELLSFQDENPAHANKALWRSCSLMLGSVVSNAFKDHIEVNLHSFPRPDVRSGSFVYDVEIPSLPNWKPSTDELRVFSAEMVKLSSMDLPFEPLTVNEELAFKIFEGCKFKVEQIPRVAEQNPEKKIGLYRVGKHIEMSRGPMMANTNLVGRCTITAVHELKHDTSTFYRFQGVALPRGLLLNHFAFSVIEKRAQKLNSGKLPWQYEENLQLDTEDVEVSATV